MNIPIYIIENADSKQPISVKHNGQYYIPSYTSSFCTDVRLNLFGRVMSNTNQYMQRQTPDNIYKKDSAYIKLFNCYEQAEIHCCPLFLEQEIDVDQFVRKLKFLQLTDTVFYFKNSQEVLQHEHIQLVQMLNSSSELKFIGKIPPALVLQVLDPLYEQHPTLVIILELAHMVIEMLGYTIIQDYIDYFFSRQQLSIRVHKTLPVQEISLCKPAAQKLLNTISKLKLDYIYQPTQDLIQSIIHNKVFTDQLQLVFSIICSIQKEQKESKTILFMALNKFHKLEDNVERSIFVGDQGLVQDLVIAHSLQLSMKYKCSQQLQGQYFKVNNVYFSEINVDKTEKELEQFVMNRMRAQQNIQQVKDEDVLEKEQPLETLDGIDFQQINAEFKESQSKIQEQTKAQILINQYKENEKQKLSNEKLLILQKQTINKNPIIQDYPEQKIQIGQQQIKIKTIAGEKDKNEIQKENAVKKNQDLDMRIEEL